MDTAWLVKRIGQKKGVLEILCEREGIFQRLPQTTPESLMPNIKSYTINPKVCILESHAKHQILHHQSKGLYISLMPSNKTYIINPKVCIIRVSCQTSNPTPSIQGLYFSLMPSNKTYTINPMVCAYVCTYNSRNITSYNINPKVCISCHT